MVETQAEGRPQELLQRNQPFRKTQVESAAKYDKQRPAGVGEILARKVVRTRPQEQKDRRIALPEVQQEDAGKAHECQAEEAKEKMIALNLN
jgi:hypothetical protein